MAHPRTATRAPTANHGSMTITQTNTGPSIPFSDIPSGTLRLRAEPEEQTRVKWAEDVVDNEGMGKKSSKVCCIYHAPHEPGDSSSGSDSSSSDDSEPDTSRAQRAHGPKPRRQPHEHDHGHKDADPAGNAKGNGKGKARKSSPNAYERVPKQKAKSAS